MLQRLFLQADTRQWTASRDGEPLATVFWMPMQRVSNTLWIAAPPDADETGLQRVLEAAQRDLAYYRSLSVEHPVGEMTQTIEAAGFIASRTLIWMRASATRTPIHRIEPKKEI